MGSGIFDSFLSSSSYLGDAFSNTLIAVELPFSIFKIVFLVGWVYLCLYCVQKVQIHPAVSDSYKPFANLLTLALGPAMLMLLFVLEIKSKMRRENRTITEAIKECLLNVGDNIRSVTARGRPEISLLDTSGRHITEIYSHGRTKSQDRRILDLTQQIILEALDERASDILIDPRNNTIHTIRLRIDGVLQEVDQIDSDTCQAVINSIKAVSSMDISEKRRPQDGAFVAKTADKNVSFRVASAGALSGEKLSIRVLGQNADQYRLDSIGLTRKQRNLIVENIKKPSGMILICGPTGSGKTTTLYATLNEIDLYTRNVITVEDPIEYVLTNASQIEVNPKANITFANSLRSILRQDPDIICVGEIRDEETAKIALRASQTGHMVLATIHSNSNASALIRLLDLGVTPMMLSTGLSMLISQRLVRKLCEYCKRPANLSQKQIIDYQRRSIDCSNLHEAVGCDMCRSTGYSGRIGIFDVMVVDDEIKNNILSNQLAIAQLRKEGDKRGKSNLQKEGIRTVVTGVTSVEELRRVTG
ncbi:MAG: GspE/PulE family protein [Phycisphaerales bacterium]|jgi:type II secretory ATPase GspE/PulE/Tfp pilus assembly ATPase PilB-like protein